MLSDTQPQVFHDFLTKLCSADYLFGLAWRGSPTIPAENQSGRFHYIAVLSDQFDIQTIRAEIAAFCLEQNKAETDSSIHVIRQKSAARYFMLNPELAQRIEAHGWQSRLGWLAMIRSAGEQRTERAWFMQQLMQISADLLEPSPQFERLNALSKQPPVSAFAGGVEIYGRLLDSVSDQDSPTQTNPTSPPHKFPAPVAIYHNLNRIILVTNEPRETLLMWGAETNNSDIKKLRQDGVVVCTPEQLNAVATQFGSLDVKLRRYRHMWGDQLLDSSIFAAKDYSRNAAEYSSSWELECIGRQMFTTPPDPNQDRLLIHDFQNRLLNIRLQNQILSDLKIIPKSSPEFDLPDKALPIHERLNTISALFDWWANNYFAQARSG